MDPKINYKLDADGEPLLDEHGEPIIDSGTVVTGPIQTSPSGRTGRVDTVTGPREAIISPTTQPEQQDGYYIRSLNYARGDEDKDPTLLGQVWKGGGDFVHGHPISMAAALVAPELTLGGALVAGGLGAMAEYADSKIRGDEHAGSNALVAGIANGVFHGIGGLAKNAYKNMIGKAATEIAEYPAKIETYNKNADFIKGINSQNAANFKEMSAAARADTKAQLGSGVKNTPLAEMDIDAQIANLKNPPIYNPKPLKTNGISQEAMDYVANNPMYADYSEAEQMRIARDVQKTLDKHEGHQLDKLDAYKNMMIGEYEKIGVPLKQEDISPTEVANWVKNKHNELLAAKEAAKGNMTYGKGELSDMMDDMTQENLLKYAKKDLTESDANYTRYANNPNRISDDKALAHLKELRTKQPLPAYPLQPNGVDLTGVLGPTTRYTYKAATKLLPENWVDAMSGPLEHNQAIPKLGNKLTAGLAGEGGLSFLKPIFNVTPSGASGVIPALVRGIGIPVEREDIKKAGPLMMIHGYKTIKDRL